MAGDVSGLGAGLSGFAQGFASTFETAQDRKVREDLEEKKNTRELFVKGLFDPKAPLSLDDPATQRTAAKLFGPEALPVMGQVSKAHQDYLYATRAKEAQAAAAAESAVGQPGTTVTTGPKGTTVKREGPKLAEPLSDVEAKAAARARGTESVRGPAQQKREDRAARRKEQQDIRNERRQFRDTVRKTAMKLRSDPSTRPAYRRLMDWVTGTKPDQRLSDALSGIPAEALPPSLQQQQQQPQAGAAAPAVGGTTQSGRVSWKPVTQ